MPGNPNVAAGETNMFTEDNYGHIWIKKRESYSIYLPEKDTLYFFEPPGFHAPINAGFARDTFGNMWLLNEAGWIYRTSVDNPEIGIIDTLVLDDVRERIYGLATDSKGNLWMPREKHITKFNPANRSLTTFNYNYGTNPDGFFSFQILDDSMMVFGMREGLIILNPDSLHSNTILAKPYITDVEVQGDPLPASILNKGGILHLKPDENFFTIGFSAIAHTGGKNNRYKYRLRDFQSEWINAKDGKTATYTNVPSGDYTFELAVANNEGVWNPEVLLLPVHIEKHWYNTWLARILMALVLSGMAYVIYRYRVEQIRKEERLRTHYQRQLADMEMSALRAQMNPHFIFNCLNSIENFVIKNETLKASTYLNDFARLIRLILQNSRSSYVPVDDELEALELYLQMESLRFVNKFDYQVIVAPEVSSGNIEIPPMLIQPYVENAIWHGLIPRETGGMLTITMDKDNGMLRCVVEDNGIGRKKSQEIRESKAVRGKRSMGMSITGDRIKLLNLLHDTNTQVEIHDLTDENGNGTGTRVELKIPY